eukprot:m51a1_g14370 hypothetical protein (441) ;mRNA; f:252686-254106
MADVPQCSVSIAVLGDDDCAKEDLLFSFVGIASGAQSARALDARYALNYTVDGRPVALYLHSASADTFLSRSPALGSPAPAPSDAVAIPSASPSAAAASPSAASASSASPHKSHIHFPLPRRLRSAQRRKSAVAAAVAAESAAPAASEEAEGAEGPEWAPPPGSQSVPVALAATCPDVFLVAYSVADPPSLERCARAVRALGRSRAFGAVPAVLAALSPEQRAGAAAERCLLRHERAPVDTAEGLCAAREALCAAYAECSPATTLGVRELFEACVRCAVSPELVQSPAALRVNRAVVVWVTDDDDAAQLGVDVQGVGCSVVSVRGVAELSAWLVRWGASWADRLRVLCEGPDETRAAREVVAQWLAACALGKKHKGLHVRKDKDKGRPALLVVALARSPDEEAAMRKEFGGSSSSSSSPDVAVAVCGKLEDVQANLFIQG